MDTNDKPEHELDCEADVNMTTDTIHEGSKIASQIYQRNGLIGLLFAMLIVSQQVNAYLDRDANSKFVNTVCEAVNATRAENTKILDSMENASDFQQRTDSVHSSQNNLLERISLNTERVAMLLEQLLAKNSLSANPSDGT